MSDDDDSKMLIRISTEVEAVREGQREAKLDRQKLAESIRDDREKWRIELKKEIEGLKIYIVKNYVTKHEFEPVKKFVWGLISAVVGGVLVALLALVIR